MICSLIGSLFYVMENNTRNFCIIAHIDHGKSTLADRLLEITKTVEKRHMKEQLLDQMDIERERGITIKLAPVRMNYKLGTTDYILNLIDTPGHVDFTYEVSRSLAAVEGALLLVDASQGVQAQTIGNLYLAVEEGLTLIPVINKIDLPNADVGKAQDELMHLLGCKREEILLVSGKTGQGVAELLEAIIKQIPPPKIETELPLRALIFDSVYDEYRGIVAYVRVAEGTIKAGAKIQFFATRDQSEVIEVGYFKPKYVKGTQIQAGEIGYIVTGLKNLAGCRVGDTITVQNLQSPIEPLPGYVEIKPMVFAGIFPASGDEYGKLREGMEKLKLNDAALQFEPESSSALGFGFRAGLLGLLHLEIVQERLRREGGLEVVVTVPSVAYKVTTRDQKIRITKSPQDFPDPSHLESVQEPWVRVDVVSPRDYIGGIMKLVSERRGIYQNTEYLTREGSTKDEGRVILHYQVPLAEILVDFYDNLKSVSSGYASLNYDFLDYRPTDVVKLEIRVAEEPVEALSMLVFREHAQAIGRRVVDVLKDVIPKQQFEIKIQAALGGTIVASSRITAYRKDVTGYLYGGDITRKMKLLEKQKKGKKKMKGKGHVEIPPEAYLAVLKK